MYIQNGNAEKAMESTSDELTKVRCMLDMDKKDEAFKKLQEI